MPYSPNPPFPLKELERFQRAIRQELGENVVSPVPGILVSEESLEEILAAERSAQSLFNFFWESAYEVEARMRGGWTREQQHKWAVTVARSTLLLLFRSKPGTLWKNGYCLLVEKADGTIEPLLVRGNEQASIVVKADPVDTVFLSALSTAQAEARKSLANVEPTPMTALLIFAAKTSDGHIQVHYHAFTGPEIKTLTQRPPVRGEARRHE